MKGGEGRRGPLTGLRERFSFDAIKHRLKSEEDREQANALRIMQAQAARHSQPRKARIVRVEHPNAKVVAKRRRKRKGVTRKNLTKRVNYLKAQRRRIAR